MPATKSERVEGSAPGPAEEEVLRSQTYRLLAALLARPPETELLSLVAAAHTDESPDGPLAEPWRNLAEAAGAADVQAVDDEYHDLFIGVGHGEVIPYASWYRAGTLTGRPLAELRRDLEALGFERQEGVSEPEDHASAVLEVMSVLSDPEPGVAFESQRRFFVDHVQPWMERFFGDVEAAGSADFFRAVGGFGRVFIRVEERYLSVDD